MTWVIVIAGLVGLVMIHELGHFWVALALKMRPRSFYIGFPPAVVKIKRRGIEYGIGAIPLGGFVRIPGMNRPAARDLHVQLQPAVGEVPELSPAVFRLRRALDAEDYAAARIAYLELEPQVAAASLTKSARRSAGRGLRDVEEGTGPEAYWRAPAWKRISVIAAGPAANVLAAFFILFGVYGLSGASGSSPAKLVGVEAHKPAAVAGMRTGDVVLSVNGRRADLGNLSGLIQSADGHPVKVAVVRHGRVVTVGPVTPVWLDGRWILGIGLTPMRFPVTKAATTAGSDLWHMTTGTATGLVSLVERHSGSQVTTGIGIARYSAAALRVSVAWWFQVLAFVSLSLALMNLIPILPLDGGHILFTLIERIRGRALAREVYERASLIGLTLILLVFVIAVASNPTGAVPH